MLTGTVKVIDSELCHRLCCLSIRILTGCGETADETNKILKCRDRSLRWALKRSAMSYWTQAFITAVEKNPKSPQHWFCFFLLFISTIRHLKQNPVQVQWCLLCSKSSAERVTRASSKLDRLPWSIPLEIQGVCWSEPVNGAGLGLQPAWHPGNLILYE